MDRTAYNMMYEMDKAHFWRLGKRNLVLEMAEKFGPGQDGVKILDIGGACSLTSVQMGRFGSVEVVEPDAAIADLARKELGLTVHAGYLPDQIPAPDGAYQIITLLDVLEHVDDDLASLQAIYAKLAPGGILICNVPALQSLWSDHDVALHHKRRYAAGPLRALLQAAGFEVRRLTYWNMLLLPLLVAERAMHKSKKQEHVTYYTKVPSKVTNLICGAVPAVERGLMKAVDLPIGSSLLAVCEKPRG
jgi:2-polyprenyl-3-methyl-5-hydroxy-6-metoxy-1,4-benzoquinol methylase